MRRLFDPQKLAARRPEALKVVVLALDAPKDMHDYVAEVEELPAGMGRALAAGVGAGVGVLDGLGERLELARRVGGGEDEVIGEAGDRGDVEQDDFLGLPLREFAGDASGKLCVVQVCLLLHSGRGLWRSRRAAPRMRERFARGVRNGREYIIAAVGVVRPGRGRRRG